jgi:hypothetical protein
MYTVLETFEFLKQRIWVILIAILVLGLLLLLTRGDSLFQTKEGFTSSSYEFHKDRAIVCPSIKLTLDGNRSLLEKHTERNAVTSMQNTQDLIDHFMKSYEEHECEEYFTHPSTKDNHGMDHLYKYIKEKRKQLIGDDPNAFFRKAMGEDLESYVHKLGIAFTDIENKRKEKEKKEKEEKNKENSDDNEEDVDAE